MRWLVVTTMVLAIGCSRKESDRTPPPVPPRKPGLKIGNKPVETTVLAIGTEAQSSIRVSMHVGEAADLNCDALTSAYPWRPAVKAGALIDFWVAQPRQADGQPGGWTVRGAHIADPQGNRSVITRSALLDDLFESESSILLSRLEFTLQDPQQARQLIHWQGDMNANNCGRVKRKELDRPQNDLKLSIGGQAAPVRGATLHPKNGKHYLRLTGVPHGCASPPNEGYDFYLDVTFSGEPAKFEFAALGGDWFPDSPAGSSGKKNFSLSVGDKTPTTVSLNGSVSLHGIEVRLSGEVSALRCEPNALQ